VTDLITTAEAASRKGCTRQAIINAITRGDLNAFKLGGTWAVYDDGALAAYEVKETGGRTHRAKEEASDEVSADT